MEQLTASLGNAFAVSENNIYGYHPHFADYKNEGKILKNQRRRREEYLERQSNRRNEYYFRIRSMYDGMRCEEMDIQPTPASAVKAENLPQFHGCVEDGFEGMNFSRWGLGAKCGMSQSKPKRAEAFYADALMFSEWLVDIPSQLDTEWMMVPCPVGKRCLLIATRGLTSVYNKTGYRLSNFQTDFPGGNRADPVSFTMIDCIMDKANRRYYALDLICWDGEQFTEKDFLARRAFLTEKFAALPQLADPGPDEKRYTFALLDACECNVDAMTAFLRQEFNFNIDGLLFYYSKALYRPGQTPLVGWLKVWMLPEILHVEVPVKYTYEQGFYTSTKHFIDRFNEKHHFKSSIFKSSEAAEADGEPMDSATKSEPIPDMDANHNLQAVAVEASAE